MDETTSRTPQEMKEKIDAFRNGNSKSSKGRSSVSAPVSIIITIISDLLGGLLVGAGLGYLLVKFFNAHMLVFAVFVLLGGFAGLLNLYKSLKKMEGQQK